MPLTLGLVLQLTGAANAKPKSLSIVEKIEYYSISGKTAAELATSMSNNGPYSRQHRQRAWATARRDMSYQLTRQKFKKNCRVKSARVKMTIIYTMPKPRKIKRVPRRVRQKWAKMYSLLNRHERTHGLYYKQLAKKIHRSLSTMKPASNCRSLNKKAKQLVDIFIKRDTAKNNRFDEKDTRNYRRMERIYRGS